MILYSNLKPEIFDSLCSFLPDVDDGQSVEARISIQYPACKSLCNRIDVATVTNWLFTRFNGSERSKVY